VSFAEMVPRGEVADPTKVLREQTRRLTAVSVKDIDGGTLQMFNPLVARPLEVPSRHR
jgi:hypothetical protein